VAFVESGESAQKTGPTPRFAAFRAADPWFMAVAVEDEFMPTIYKICNREDWESALAQGLFAGSAIDRQDGFIHFSAARQLRETARRHFAHRLDLVLIAVESEALGPDLRWEKSRGGDLFPHLYGPLAVKSVRSVVALPWHGTAHDFPPDIPS
jgi:uncharacterized protein (DUF952 family)